MARLLRTDGIVTEITERLTLPVMQRLVGGYIEMVKIGGTFDRQELLIVDEDGHAKQKPLNQAATSLYRGTPAKHDGVIVGDAIRCICTNMGRTSEAYE